MRATHVLADFDRTIADAEALLKERPVIPSLTDAQIKRMAEAYYAARLANDEEERREGTGSEPLFQSIAKQLSAAGIEYQTSFSVGATPEAGLSDREVLKRVAHSSTSWPSSRPRWLAATSASSEKSWTSC
ncbi:hypothetical protein ABIF74_011763 [Bradyrhizobium japonicum]